MDAFIAFVSASWVRGWARMPYRWLAAGVGWLVGRSGVRSRFAHARLTDVRSLVLWAGLFALLAPRTLSGASLDQPYHF